VSTPRVPPALADRRRTERDAIIARNYRVNRRREQGRPGISALRLMTPCRSRNRWTSDRYGRDGSVPPEHSRSLDTNRAAYAYRHKQAKRGAELPCVLLV
jgi:hypothetical protein